MQYVIDTHALVWFLEGNPRLGAEARSVLEHTDSRLILPAIALAEAVWIVERGRTSISSAQSLLAVVRRDRRLTVWALDVQVIEFSLQLIAIPEMHDRQIVATVLALQLEEPTTLLTCDRIITSTQAVRVVWD
ncbi:MAG: type II toxin-antitoxin system VapC family toxin [Spirulinaceae cyanobacterium SM2_1_0]|nr:type II toxin-antitoxin system VapC family toxin [Spirulinaceae cyanobacterium SM2_1_0]